MIRTKPVIAARDTLTFTAISETTQIDLINSSRHPPWRPWGTLRSPRSS